MTLPADDASDPDLIAYLDGELDPHAAELVEDRLASDPALQARLTALRQSFDLLDHLPTPGPSRSFTVQTMAKLVALPPLEPAADSNPTRLETPSTNVPNLSHRPSGRWLLGVAALGVAAVSGAGLRWSVPPAGQPINLAADYRVSQRLPWTTGVDNLAFLQALAGANLFPTEPPVPTPPTPVSPPDKLIAAFQALPAPRQAQLRTLETELTALPEADQARLNGVLERYAVWLHRQPAADRAELLVAPATERLDRIRAHLAPRSTQPHANLWTQTDFDWSNLTGKPWPFTDAALTEQVEEFVRDVLKAELTARADGRPDPSLFGRLSREEYQDLRMRRELAPRDNSWGLYGLQVYRLAARHPTLPEPPAGRIVAVDVKTIPSDFLRALRRRQLLTKVEVGSTRGRWPEFALELAAVARENGLTVPPELGPCRPDDLTPSVRQVLTEQLQPRLTEPERRNLVALEGQWPAYPQELTRLAALHDLPLPGVTLPGPPSQWAAVYAPPASRP